MVLTTLEDCLLSMPADDLANCTTVHMMGNLYFSAALSSFTDADSERPVRGAIIGHQMATGRPGITTTTKLVGCAHAASDPPGSDTGTW